MYILKKIGNALRGFFLTIIKDRGVQFQVGFALITIPLLLLFLYPLTPHEYALLLIGYAFLYITELQNTALEISLDRLHPEKHESIRDSKDIAAASTLVSLGVFILLVSILFADRFLI